MIVKRQLILQYLIVSTIIGAVIFVYGFFPIAYKSNQRAEFNDLPESIDDIPINKSVYDGHISRTTLMIIDALRTDFIQHQENKSMKYVNKLINEGSACIVNLTVETPTVTMPRIKAMTTGTIPNFIDVVLNLGSSEINIDSLLHQVYDKGRKIVFCGDDTWVKMFPEMFYRKMENQDSLFVNDFHEGDKNITQKLSAELKRSDWELLILHYLGLDHIGHVEGPFSSKISPKLREMDTVIMHIHLAMLDWMKTNTKPPLLIVTGDHGMRDTGGHGGSSYAETNVPLVFIGAKCNQDDDVFKQIDIAPTLSVLMGLPIPASSIGIIVPHLIMNFTMEQKLYAYYYNGKRLLNKLIDLNGIEQVKDKEFYIQFLDAVGAHKTFLKASAEDVKRENILAFKRAEMRYTSSAKVMSESLSESFIAFDDFSISLGLIYITTTLICLVLLAATSDPAVKISLRLSLVLALIACAACFKTELYSPISTTSEFKNFTPNFLSLFYIFNLFFIAISNIQFLVKFYQNADFQQSINLIGSMPLTCKYLLLGVIFHGISFVSSSFIEEEHHTWYYLTNSALLILYIFETGRFLQQKDDRRKSNATERDIPPAQTYSFADSQLQWIFLFVCHAVAQHLNQTGDKWAHLPDIGDWLLMDEHLSWNSLFSGVSIILVYVNCMDFGNILTNVIAFTLCTLIYLFHATNGFVYFAGVKLNDSSDMCLYLFWLGIIEIVALNYMPILFRCFYSAQLKRHDIKVLLGTNIITTSLIISLLFKSYNIFLVAVLLFTSSKLKSVCSAIFRERTELSYNILTQCILHVWMGKEFFFYQGNSNSLATIDLTAGYVGLKNFHFFTVGIFLTLSTYSGPILSFLLFLYNFYEHDENQPNEEYRHSKHDKNARPPTIIPVTKVNTLNLLAILIVLPFVLYSYFILMFRQHIFIWSVFSPKLLYEFYYLCLMCAFVIFSSVLYY